jgi:hypothetical protein
MRFAFHGKTPLIVARLKVFRGFTRDALTSWPRSIAIHH